MSKTLLFSPSHENRCFSLRTRRIATINMERDMPKPHPAKEFFPSLMKTGPERLSDPDLVSRCLRKDDNAWDEFFRRFTPSIIEGIQKEIVSRDRGDLAHDEDVLWEIHRRVMERLYLNRVLEQCTDLAGIRAWLRRLGINKAKDWFREQNRNKRLPEKQSTESAVSLNAPLGKDERETLEGAIPAEPPLDESVRAYLERVLAEMDDTTGKENKEWALRLSILLYLPLSDEELKALCGFSGYDMQEVKARVQAMTREAEKKSVSLAESRSKVVQYWHEIKRMEGVLAHKMRQNMPGERGNRSRTENKNQ